MVRLVFDAEIRRSIVDAARRLYIRGLNSTLSGNISARSSNKRYFWITPGSRDKARLSIEDLSLVDVESGNRVMGREPSSEYRMHLLLYRVRGDVNAIIHTHQLYTTIAHRAGLLRRELLEESYEARIYLRGISFVPRLEPGSLELAEAVARELSERGKYIAVIEGHGVVAVGGEVAEALNRAEILEIEAKRLVNLAIMGVIAR
jgi:L-fuculose-phosphate aldolase